MPYILAVAQHAKYLYGKNKNTLVINHYFFSTKYNNKVNIKSHAMYLNKANVIYHIHIGINAKNMTLCCSYLGLYSPYLITLRVIINLLLLS